MLSLTLTLNWKWHRCVFGNPTWAPCLSRLYLPNLLWSHNCGVRHCADGVHVLCPHTLLQSHPQQVWMQVALFCVAIIQVCAVQGSTHNMPICVVIVGFPRDLIVLNRTSLFEFQCRPSMQLILLVDCMRQWSHLGGLTKESTCTNIWVNVFPNNVFISIIISASSVDSVLLIRILKVVMSGVEAATFPV
jgi:hypothetical protein